MPSVMGAGARQARNRNRPVSPRADASPQDPPRTASLESEQSAQLISSARPSNFDKTACLSGSRGSSAGDASASRTYGSVQFNVFCSLNWRNNGYGDMTAALVREVFAKVRKTPAWVLRIRSQVSVVSCEVM